MSILAITDGTSNTFLVAEAAEAVPWTKPEDLVVDDKKPLPKLGGQFANVFNVAFADGSVHFITSGIDEQTLRNLINPADGNVIDFDKLEGEPGRPQPGKSVRFDSNLKPETPVPSPPAENVSPPLENPPIPGSQRFPKDR
jgi:prepilin-type processing-associated H-X9-DG protein